MSAVISASDLDAVTLRRPSELAYPCKGALPSGGIPLKVGTACLQALAITTPLRCCWWLGSTLLLLVAGCGNQPGGSGFGFWGGGTAADAPAPLSKARIGACLEATGGKLPTLYPPDPLDIPVVRPTPKACHGIEQQVQDAVQAQLIQDCDRATRLLTDGGQGLPDQQRRWAEVQIRRCVGGNPDIFYW